jgi:hypothetical protein
MKVYVLVAGDDDGALCQLRLSICELVGMIECKMAPNRKRPEAEALIEALAKVLDPAAVKLANDNAASHPTPETIQ